VWRFVSLGPDFIAKIRVCIESPPFFNGEHRPAGGRAASMQHLQPVNLAVNFRLPDPLPQLPRQRTDYANRLPTDCPLTVDTSFEAIARVNEGRIRSKYGVEREGDL